MIDLYTWGTPNGRKVSILLEELNLDYAVHPIDISAGDQFAPEFLELSPNNRIPAIHDRSANVRMMESGAIMLYLADRERALIPDQGQARLDVLQWLMWQMGGVGPMLGQAHHFLHFFPGKSAYAEDRYRGEVRRLYRVLNSQLEKNEYVAGDYSIADIAIWPWIARFEWQQIDLFDFPEVRRWYRTVRARKPVQLGYDVPRGGEVSSEG